MKVTPVTGNRGNCVFPSRCNLPRKEAADNFSCPSVYHVLTKTGNQKIKEFIKKCEEKRELILKNGIDTANVEIMNEGDINIDLFFNNSPSKGENFQHAYPVTDHFAQDLVLEYEVDFFDSEKEEHTISILNVVEEFLKEKECEIPWQQSDGDCKVKKQELIERLRKFL